MLFHPLHRPGEWQEVWRRFPNGHPRVARLLHFAPIPYPIWDAVGSQVCVYTCVCVYVCALVYDCVCVYVCALVYGCVCVYVCALVYGCVYVCHQHVVQPLRFAPNPHLFWDAVGTQVCVYACVRWCMIVHMCAPDTYRSLYVSRQICIYFETLWHTDMCAFVCEQGWVCAPFWDAVAQRCAWIWECDFWCVCMWPMNSDHSFSFWYYNTQVCVHLWVWVCVRVPSTLSATSFGTNPHM